MFVHKVENRDRRLDLVEFSDFCRALSLDPQEVFGRWLAAVENTKG